MDTQLTKKSFTILGIKDNLEPVIQGYVNLMIKDLVAREIIKPPFASDLKNAPIDLKPNIEDAIVPGRNAEEIGREVSDFRELIQSIYLNTQGDSSMQRDSIQVSKFVEQLHDGDIINMPKIKSNAKNILDKGIAFFNGSDPETPREAAELLDLDKSFGLNRGRLLEYFVEQVSTVVFADYQFARPQAADHAEVDVLGTAVDGYSPDILIEVAYRKRGLTSLREDIIRIFDKMSSHTKRANRDACAVLVLFIDEGSDTVDRMIYRFGQYMEELFPHFSDSVYLVPIFIKNLHLLKSELERIKVTIAKTNPSEVQFQLNSLPGNPGKVDDDNVHEQLYDLNQFNYELAISPVVPMKHWRVGLRFAGDSKFPDRAERHMAKYPLFHVQKDEGTSFLLVSYYDSSGQWVYEAPTKLQQDAPFAFIVSYAENVTTVDVVDKNKDSVLDQQLRVPGATYFKLAAWADGQNSFAFDVQVRERKKRQSVDMASHVDEEGLHRMDVRVIDSADKPVAGAQVLFLSDNNTHHDGYSGEDGHCKLNLPAGSKYAILVAHPSYSASITENVDSDALSVSLSDDSSVGSIIIPQGTGYIPGLQGRINPILDPGLRKYLYADNVAIESGKQQPVGFEIDTPLLLTDRNNISFSVNVRFIRGRTSVIDFRPVP